MGAAIGIAGAVMSGVSAIAGGKASQDAADYQSQVARNNAAIAKQNAQYTMEAGNQQVTTQGMKTRQQVGTIKANQGAGGIDVNTGSAAQVRSAAAELGALDAMTIRSNTARKAYGYEVEAQNQENNAKLLKVQGKNAMTAGILNGVGSFLSGASSVGAKYAGWQNVTGGGNMPAGDAWGDVRDQWGE